MTATTTTLAEFLSQHPVIRVWYTSTDSPAGRQYEINTEADGEDYCDAEGLHSIITDYLRIHEDSEISGRVTTDADGEFRWTWESEDYSFTTLRGNIITQLVVWGS